MKKIFMVCYGGGHMKIMAPLYFHLRERYEVIILALTVSGEYFESLDIPFIRLSDFQELLTSEVVTYGNMIADKSKTSNNLPREETIAYHGLSFVDLIEQEGSFEAAIGKYRKFGRTCFLPVPTLSRVLDTLKPDVVIATNAPRGERASLIAAKNLSIPTICINDNAWIENGAKEVAEQQCADIICVLSDEVKNSLSSVTRFPESRIIVTGTPVFDRLKGLKQNILSRNLKPTILLADCELPERSPSYPGVIADKELGNRVRNKLNKLSKTCMWNVVFRPHPSQDYDYSSYTNVRISKPSDDLLELLLTVDVIVTAISTVGLEGKVLNKGLVSIEGSVYRALGSYEELGLSTGIKGEEELEEAIRTEIRKTEKASELYSGESAENIEIIIRKLCQ